MCFVSTLSIVMMVISNSFSGSSYTSISLGSVSKDLVTLIEPRFLFLHCPLYACAGTHTFENTATSLRLYGLVLHRGRTKQKSRAEEDNNWGENSTRGSQQMWSSWRKNQKTWRQVLWNYPVRGKQCVNKRIGCLESEHYISTQLPGITLCISHQSKGLIHYWDL